jgi:hypothetical protein
VVKIQIRVDFTLHFTGRALAARDRRSSGLAACFIAVPPICSRPMRRRFDEELIAAQGKPQELAALSLFDDTNLSRHAPEQDLE